MSARVSCLVMVVLGAGCVARDGEMQIDAVEQDTGGGCDEFQCGTNSPQIAELGFWELNFPASLDTAGLPNNIGLQVLGFFKDPYVYVPKVFGGRLTVSRRETLPPYGTIALSGSDLVGGWLSLRKGDRLFRMRISEVGHVDSWAQPGPDAPRVTVESYRLDWSELANNTWSEFRTVSSEPPGDATDSLTMTGPYVLHTLLFEGDRIDATRKAITGIDPSWVNFGVAGSALAKLALTGHTEAARNASTFVTTLPERQAMLKLLVADYCGDGSAFTVAGQPLNWRDDRGTMALSALAAQPPQPLVLEARWTAAGAACLDQPRVDVHWTSLGEQVFGADVYNQVKDHCAASMPPPCAGGFEVDGYHLLSATVPFQPPP